MSRDVVLADMGAGNLGSLRYALERLGVAPVVSREAETIRKASHVVLPGVGAAGPAMKSMRMWKLDEVLRGLTQPLLGVCLGMQLLFEYSEEGDVPGLGLLSGKVERLKAGKQLRIPHMGWNECRVRHDDALLDAVHGTGAFVYFVHSYAVAETPDTLATTDYGGEFSAVVRRGNVCGMQFHPERSAAVGQRLLANFLAL